MVYSKKPTSSVDDPNEIIFLEDHQDIEKTRSFYAHEQAHELTKLILNCNEVYRVMSLSFESHRFLHFHDVLYDITM